jgi:hypothetical protein
MCFSPAIIATPTIATPTIATPTIETTTEPTELYDIVVITSIYATKWNAKLWSILHKLADVVLVLDAHDDAPLLENDSKIRVCNTVCDLINAAKRARVVVSGRLHGAVLCALHHVPTIAVITDSGTSDVGSFKFEAVCQHATDFDKPLATVLTANDLCEYLSISSEPTLMSRLISIVDKKTHDRTAAEYFRLTVQSMKMLEH